MGASAWLPDSVCQNHALFDTAASAISSSLEIPLAGTIRASLENVEAVLRNPVRPLHDRNDGLVMYQAVECKRHFVVKDSYGIPFTSHRKLSWGKREFIEKFVSYVFNTSILSICKDPQHGRKVLRK